MLSDSQQEEAAPTENVDFDIDCQQEFIELQSEDIMKDQILPNCLSQTVGRHNLYTGRHTLTNKQPATRHIPTQESRIQSQASDPKTPKVDEHNTSTSSTNKRHPQIIFSKSIAQNQTDLGKTLAHEQPSKSSTHSS